MSIQMPPKPKFSKKFLIYLIISVGILVFLLLKDGPVMIEYIIDSFITLIVIFDVLPLAIYLFFFIPKCMDYHLAKTNFPKYVKEQEELQRRKAEYNRQQQIENERKQKIIEKERPDVLLPNLGGQSGLNLCSELAQPKLRLPAR